MKRFISPFLACLLIFQILGCGSGVNNKDNGGTTPSVNTAPTANAGDDQSVFESNLVTLDASASSDSDGSIISYQWVEKTNSGVSIANDTNSSATFTAPNVDADTVLTFELTVTDNDNATKTDSINITIKNNTSPIANAGDDQFAMSNDVITLDASASTDFESSITYTWQQTDSTGVNITLSDINVIKPTFVAAVTEAKTFIFEVTVTDSSGLFDSSSVNISFQPLITQKINDTGIVLCGDYSDDGAVTVPRSNSENCDDSISSGGLQIPDGQDADFGRDITVNVNADTDGAKGFSFTKLDANGNPLPQSATSWRCVLDNVTHLTWEVKTTESGLQYYANTYSWFNSDPSNNGSNVGTTDSGSCSGSFCDTEFYVTAINDTALCGFVNWKTPSLEQLRSIIDYGISSPYSLDTRYFPNTASTKYWTSISYKKDTSKAWFLDFFNSNDGYNAKSLSQAIRLVHE